MHGNKRIVGDGPDYYPTPAWATEALLASEPFSGKVLEPCCGEGHMSEVLLRAGIEVESSDLYDRGYGAVGVDATKLDRVVENIITNPPYALATELLPVFLAAATKKVALLLRMSFLESKKRYSVFQDNPPARVYVFSERLTLSPSGVIVKGGGTVSYGWFVWDGKPDYTELRWIPPGLKRSTAALPLINPVNVTT